MAIPLLDAIDIEDKDLTADALLTQRKIADYLVRKRKAHYHFIVKGNQPTLLQGIRLYFHDRQEPDFVDYAPPDHGRIETRNPAARGTGPQPNSTTTSTFPTSDKLSSSNGSAQKKRQANTLRKSPTASPAERLTKPMPNVFLPPTAATGESRTAATTSLIGTMMKTAAGYALATSRKTSLDSDYSPLASSNPKA